jgi:hypothetical protein
VTKLKDLTYESRTSKKKKTYKLKTQEIFNKTVAEKFPNVEKEMVIQVQEAFRTPEKLH